MKKLMIMVVVAASAAGAWAHGCGPCGPCRPGWRPCGPGWGPRPCHGDWWGRGGCNFWPGFIGGVVGGVAYNAVARPYCYSSPVVVSQPVVVQQPTVVTQPVVVQQQPVIVQQPSVQTVVTQPARVWVEGRYVDQVQANGTVVRVWQPGHYE